jgi:hypothetical protein
LFETILGGDSGYPVGNSPLVMGPIPIFGLGSPWASKGIQDFYDKVLIRARI